MNNFHYSPLQNGVYGSLVHLSLQPKLAVYKGQGFLFFSSRFRGFPLCTLGPKTASGAYWHKSILSQHHLKNWPGKSSLTFMSVSPQCLLQESQTAQPSVSLLFAVLLCPFPRLNGCGFRFYRKCSACPFFGEQWDPIHQASC